MTYEKRMKKKGPGQPRAPDGAKGGESASVGPNVTRRDVGVVEQVDASDSKRGSATKRSFYAAKNNHYKSMGYFDHAALLGLANLS
jgi:hypothetical protein